MKQWRVLLIFFLLALSLLFLAWSGLLPLSTPEWAKGLAFPSLKSLSLNRKANAEFKAQNFNAAFDEYVKALEYEPFAPEIHLDLGLTYEFQQLPEKAALSYQNAYLYSSNEGLRFASLFNQAQLLGKAKKTDEALALYQQALDIDPTSKEVKTNIELLTQQQQGQGKDQDKDQKQDQKQDQKNQQNDQNKDQNKDQNQKNQQNQDQKKDQGQDQNKDQQKDQGQDKKDQPKDQQNKQYQQNQKYQPRPFKGEQLSEGDVKKILGEIKQQEQKIRQDYNRKEVKEQPRDKDW